MAIAAACGQPAYLGSKLAKSAVDLYRRFISPRKGFRCACGAAGGHTCSTFASKYLLRRYPVSRAAPLMAHYFQRCRHSVDVLKAVPLYRVAPPFAVAQVAAATGLTPYQSAQRLAWASEEMEEHEEGQRNKSSKSAAVGNDPLLCNCVSNSLSNACDMTYCGSLTLDIGVCDAGACDVLACF